MFEWPVTNLGGQVSRHCRWSSDIGLELNLLNLYKFHFLMSRRLDPVPFWFEFPLQFVGADEFFSVCLKVELATRMAT